MHFKSDILVGEGAAVAACLCDNSHGACLSNPALWSQRKAV